MVYLMSGELLRPRDVAKIFGVSVKTLEVVEEGDY